MRVWLDISNSPHINFFKGLIRDLKADGHDVVITCRPLANTVDLLELHGLDHEVVGLHYGKSIVKKIFGFPIRVAQLYKYLKQNRPDVAISHSSFHSPITSRLLGCRSIYLNDNEHALGNVPSFLFANTIMIPEHLSVEKISRLRRVRNKTIQYPGVKEGVYLWEMPINSSPAEPEQGSAGPRPKIYVRPEPWTAQYYKGGNNFMDDLLLELANNADVTVLPRGTAQAEHYLSDRFSSLRIEKGVSDLPTIAADCALFIGAGGTMTREMAVLGIPTISVYQDDLLDVDNYLISIKQMMHKPDLDAPTVLQYLQSHSKRESNHELLKHGREAFQLIKSVLLGRGV